MKTPQPRAIRASDHRIGCRVLPELARVRRLGSLAPAARRLKLAPATHLFLTGSIRYLVACAFVVISTSYAAATTGEGSAPGKLPTPHLNEPPRQVVEDDEHANARPLLTPNGPVSDVRSISFAPNGDYFVTGGNDKLLRVWSLLREGENDYLSCTLTDRLFWQISRGSGGTIQTTSISPDGTQVAIAGIAGYGGRSDIGLFSLRTGSLIRNLITDQLDGKHLSALAFTGDSKQLVCLTHTGELVVWDLATDEPTLVELPGDGRWEPIRPMTFISPTEFVVAVREDRENWRLEIRDSRTPQRVQKKLPLNHKGFVTALTRAPGQDNWASADALGSVYVWQGVDNPTNKQIRNGLTDDGTTERVRRRAVRSVSLDGHGHVFVTTDHVAQRSAPAVAEMWRVSDGSKVDEMVLGRGTDAVAGACDAKGRYFVTTAGDEGQIVVVELRDDEGQPIDKPFQSGQIIRNESLGSQIWKVAFEDDDGYRISLAEKRKETPTFSDYGEFTVGFDLEEMSVLRQDAMPTQLKRHNASDDWRLVPNSDGRSISIERNGREAASIELDPGFQGPVSAYCWLHNDEGKVNGLAIGTANVNGIFLYSLPEDGECRLQRYLRDHNGQVTSLSVSHDGKYLASASTDQTVKVWSLAGLDARSDSFARVDAWGASFRILDDELIVQDVSSGSVADRKGLKSDDRISQVTVEGENGTELRLSKAAEIKQVFETHPLWRSIVITHVRDEEELKTGDIKVAWEPVATIFLDKEREWMIWTPEGVYNASAAGDQSVHWIVMQGRTKAPLVVRSDELRGDLEKPEVIENLLGQGNLENAIEFVGVGAAGPTVTIPVVVRRQPLIEILTPHAEEVLAENVRATIVARITYPRPDARTEFEVACFVDGVAYRPDSQVDQDSVSTYRWEVDEIAGPGVHISIVAANEYQGSQTQTSREDVFVRASDKPQRYRLHLLTLTGSNYWGGWKDLNGVKNAQTIKDAFLTGAEGPYFDMGHQIDLSDENVTPERVSSAIAELQASADIHPRDLLVVYVGGHGVVVENEYYFVPAREQVTGLEQEELERFGIPWKRMQEFSSVGCRMLFLIDTCRQSTGGAVATRSKEATRKAIMRPFSMVNSLVVTGSQPGKRAFELPSGDSIFTLAIVDGLKGQADGSTAQRPEPPEPDGTTDLREFCAFLAPRVQELVEDNRSLRIDDPEARSEFLEQTPYVGRTFLPHIPLVKD